MRKVIAYVVLVKYAVHLEVEVRDRLKEGWHLHGGVSIAADDYCYQAMVKYKPTFWQELKENF